MRQNHFSELFQPLESDVREVLVDVIIMEQEFISYERPRVKEPLDEIITRAAKAVLQRNEQADKEAR